MNDFRKRYSKFIAPYRYKSLSAENIFAEAPLRQLKLVSLCFDMCIDKVAASGKADTSALMVTRDSTESRLIRSQDFYPEAPVETLQPEEQKAIRKKMADFLQKNCDVILIIDGDVKSLARFSEKAAEAPEQDASSVNDINRLTVVSRHLDLVEAFSDGWQEKLPEDQFCAKEEWDYKKFGMLSKSNYIMIDGFPAEIHLNEPRQMMVSRILTHHVYEVIREFEPKKFDERYAALPDVIQTSVDTVKDLLPHDEAALVLDLADRLAVSLMQNARGGYMDKYDCLLDFHREAHEAFIELSSPEWQQEYTSAKLRYYKGLKAAGLETKIVTDKLKNG